MKASDRTKLTAALREHVAKIAADLRAKMRASGSRNLSTILRHEYTLV
jgi:hypothetical protein